MGKIEKINKLDQKELLIPPFSIEYWVDQEARNLGFGEDFDEFDENNLYEALHFAEVIFWDTVNAASVEVYNNNGEVIYGLYVEE